MNMPCEIGTLPLRLQCIDIQLIDSTGVQFRSNNYSLETTSNESLSEVRSLLCSQTKIAAARSLQGCEAQALIDFLDRVRTPPTSHASTTSEDKPQPQVLACSCLDGKSWQRCLRILSKICKTRRVLPTSFLLQQEPIHVGGIHLHGGSADVINGEYMGSPVAIKRLKTNYADHDKIFKVN